MEEEEDNTLPEVSSKRRYRYRRERVRVEKEEVTPLPRRKRYRKSTIVPSNGEEGIDVSGLPRRGRFRKTHTDESKEEDSPTVRSFRRRRRYRNTPAPIVTEIPKEESEVKEIMRPTESAITEAPKTKVVADDLASIRKMEKLHEERIQVNTGDLPTASASKEETHSPSATEVVNPLLSSYLNPTKPPLSLSFSVVHVSPISVILSVNVTAEATVWCGAWPLGEEMNLKMLQVSTPGVIVTDTRYYPITNLYPSTTYDVTCFGYSGSTYMTENPFMIRQSVMTKDKVFSIKEAQFNNGFIEVSLDSNLEIAVLCFLFNSKNIKIDNKLYDASQDTSILFEVPQTTTQYRVQCSALNDKNKVFSSTESVVVSVKRTNWVVIVLITVIVVLMVSLLVFAILWKKRNSVRAIYELDDAEIVTLLNKSKGQLQSSKNGEDKSLDALMSVDRTIRCGKCGFINPPSSTICRECNSLLHGNELFTSISRKLY